MSKPPEYASKDGFVQSEDFRSALASIAPEVTANLMKPGDTRLIQT